jgi:hypothetical protein
METTKRTAGSAPLSPAAQENRRMSPALAARVPCEVTLVKLAVRPLAKWATKRALLGRYLDRNDPTRGRVTHDQLDRVLRRTWQAYDALAPGAQVSRLKTRGNRQNVLLGVFSLAIFRALLAEGIDKPYATELVTDLAWKIYEKWVVLPRLAARCTHRDPQQQMNMMLGMFLRFPFSRPGYDWQTRPEAGAFALDIYRCPVRDYLRSQGEEDFMLNSWCTLDFALAQVMTRGGHYQRPHTLTAGDRLCDMTWFAKPGVASRRPRRDHQDRPHQAGMPRPLPVGRPAGRRPDQPVRAVGIRGGAAGMAGGRKSPPKPQILGASINKHHVSSSGPPF